MFSLGERAKKSASQLKSFEFSLPLTISHQYATVYTSAHGKALDLDWDVEVFRADKIFTIWLGFQHAQPKHEFCRNFQNFEHFDRAHFRGLPSGPKMNKLSSIWTIFSYIKFDINYPHISSDRHSRVFTVKDWTAKLKSSLHNRLLHRAPDSTAVGIFVSFFRILVGIVAACTPPPPSQKNSRRPWLRHVFCSQCPRMTGQYMASFFWFLNKSTAWFCKSILFFSAHRIFDRINRSNREVRRKSCGGNYVTQD